MSFKVVCVLLAAFLLFEGGQTFRINEISSEEATTVRNFVIQEYPPQAAIDKYNNIMDLVASKVPGERKKGIFETLVLFVEGALYQTELERVLLGNSHHYDVRSAMKRIEEQSDPNDDMKVLTEDKIAEIKAGLDKEFPCEVGQKIADVLMGPLRDETLAEKIKSAFEFRTLGIDGATAVVNRLKTVDSEKI